MGWKVARFGRLGRPILVYNAQTSILKFPKKRKKVLIMNTNKNEDLAGQAEVVQVPRASVPVNPEN